ncbi:MULTISPECIES: N-acetylglucosamine-6-phosphate deacetylase [Pseudolactococcus]|uniref:N-acetylglucosamine-6-phosphate deacetylase n=2 Tax=Pseudolactococcus TaxID=3436058 RepID=A0A0D6DWY4_9LACT|nr:MULTISPECIES: N-acetylglucosamine-6-phosphate deacetylase [Lactococcus]MCJ1968320.1 N-acetylglucosamine-6-phosphate deacetylase [Lactococcus carnosus]MCJ1972484.1 N-acetylglucosamine-6-phosphate deacetylase [Lactococcus carnosus]MCJ1988922.1 N-acetylglucosamine-6-phosphate deacetylase [Lactococcus carnosus]MCJ2001466.1 N-acetylglucosamine-6-phosphate deacetylase [Lactococcus carnosus]CEN28468.1 N-acetylglucosamine-6-phosphate deacetylase [Lactococcus piscium MKFS47]
MTTTYIKADKFFYPYESKMGGYLELTAEGKFGNHVEQVADGSTVLDYSGKFIAPGLVDTHVHGYAGVDVMDNHKDGIVHTMSNALLSTGVTSFLPTALTASYEQLRDICQMIGEHYTEASGAKIQGIFFEGPYFTEKYKGAQNAAYMRNPSFEEFQGWQEAAKGMLLKIAVAPERDGSAEFIAKVVETGTKVALGHSDATYEQAVRGAEAGASIWVHAYNGMRGLTHRELGMVGAVYEIPHTYAELICDGHHVVPKACDILIKQKGHDHVALITDCMRAGGEPDGDYMLGEYPVIVENGTARLKDGGNLAGSILKLKDGIKNVVDWGIASQEEAVMMASLIPAKSVGIDDKCGRIKPGFDADFIVLDPNLELSETYLKGQKVYSAS